MTAYRDNNRNLNCWLKRNRKYYRGLLIDVPKLIDNALYLDEIGFVQPRSFRLR